MGDTPSAPVRKMDRSTLVIVVMAALGSLAARIAPDEHLNPEVMTAVADVIVYVGYALVTWIHKYAFFEKEGT